MRVFVVRFIIAGRVLPHLYVGVGESNAVVLLLLALVLRFEYLRLLAARNLKLTGSLFELKSSYLRHGLVPHFLRIVLVLRNFGRHAIELVVLSWASVVLLGLIVYGSLLPDQQLLVLISLLVIERLIVLIVEGLLHFLVVIPCSFVPVLLFIIHIL